MKKNKRSFFIVTIILGLTIFLSQCINNNEVSNDVRGIAYANATSCRTCHQAIYDSALHTAHYNASALATSKNVHGNFIEGQNTFLYDSITKVAMVNTDSGMYQILYYNGKKIEAHRFDISFGKKNAQTYMYWKGDNVFELPLSFYTTAAIHAWGTSPGFSPLSPNFNILIKKSCFECHSSFINNKENVSLAGGQTFSSPEVTEAFDKNTLINGIDCQRCHGPSANHVNYHLAYPEEKTAKYMVKYASLNNQQKIDMCGICHSGNDKEKLKPRFYFLPGDSLSNFFLPSFGNNDNSDFDVHGNQQRLLAQSKCLKESKTMNCSTCHDPHKDADNSVFYYSQKCMGCHNEISKSFCSNTIIPAETLKANCVDCHMPKQTSKAITFKLQDNPALSSYWLRTHKIAIYKNE